MAVNANYSEKDKIFDYSYGHLCLSELSGPVNTPSNDYSFRLKVDAENNLYLIGPKSKLIGPVGRKTGNQFDFSLATKSVVSLHWFPQLISYLQNSDSCPLQNLENVTLRKNLNYSFVLDREAIKYSRKTVSDTLPFYLTDDCFARNAAELSKYQIVTENSGILKAQ